MVDQDTSHIDPALQKIIAKYDEVFDERKVGKIADWTYHIRLEENAEPIVHPSRKSTIYASRQILQRT